MTYEAPKEKTQVEESLQRIANAENLIKHEEVKIAAWEQIAANKPRRLKQSGTKTSTRRSA